MLKGSVFLSIIKACAIVKMGSGLGNGGLTHDMQR